MPHTRPAKADIFFVPSVFFVEIVFHHDEYTQHHYLPTPGELPGHFISEKESIVKKLLIAASIALSTGLAFADGVLKPHHGGAIVEAKSGNRIELVAEAEQLTVYLSSHDGKPVESKDVSGEITVLSGTEKTKVTLAPAGDNQMVAKAKAATGAKAIVKFTLPGKPAEQVRLTLK